MDFVQAHWVEIAVIVVAVVQIGERIAALTETKQDDAIFGAIHKVLATIGLKFPS